MCRDSNNISISDCRDKVFSLVIEARLPAADSHCVGSQAQYSLEMKHGGWEGGM